MLAYIQLCRPKHWLKNILVFFPLIFAFKFDLESFYRVFLAFGVFSLFASSIYIINDIFDQKRDRLHPKKRFRPIASGKIKTWPAFLEFIIVLTAAFAVSTYLGATVFYLCIGYFIVNLFYSFGLKNLPIVDVMIIAFGFVLRVFVGAEALALNPTHWLLLCTFFVALFLAFGKRKNEMELLTVDKTGHRKSISDYTESFINQILVLTAGVSVISYSLYTIDPQTQTNFRTDNLIYTTPLVVFGIFRYFHLLYNKREGGDPVAVFFHDIPLIIDMLLWLGSILIIYFIAQ